MGEGCRIEADVKSVLRTARRARESFEAAKRLEQETLEQITYLHATDYGGVSVQSSATSRTTEDLALRLERIHERALKRLDDLEARQRRAQEIIDRLEDDVWADVLTRYYILGDTWQQVAAGAGYSERQIYRIHGEALQWLRCH